MRNKACLSSRVIRKQGKDFVKSSRHRISKIPWGEQMNNNEQMKSGEFPGCWGLDFYYFDHVWSMSVCLLLMPWFQGALPRGTAGRSAVGDRFIQALPKGLKHIKGLYRIYRVSQWFFLILICDYAIFVALGCCSNPRRFVDQRWPEAVWRLCTWNNLLSAWLSIAP